MGPLIHHLRHKGVDLHAGEERKLLVQSWLISNALGGRRARNLAVHMQKAGRGLVPWAGVAVPLHLSQDAESELSSEPSAEIQADHSLIKSPAASPAQALMGHAFCFLPLPCSTGETLHVTSTALQHLPSFSSTAGMAHIQYVTEQKQCFRGVPALIVLRAPTEARVVVLCLQVFQCMSTATLR